jgi:hypothetical protein
MAVLFLGTRNAVMVMAVVIGAAKVVTAAWLSAKVARRLLGHSLCF